MKGRGSTHDDDDLSARMAVVQRKQPVGVSGVRGHGTHHAEATDSEPHQHRRDH